MQSSALTILISFILQYANHGQASAFAFYNGDSNDKLNSASSSRQSNTLAVPRGGGGGGGRGAGISSANGCGTSTSSGTSTCLQGSNEEGASSSSPPDGISNENWDLLSARGQLALSNLIRLDGNGGGGGGGAQSHVYGDWPEAGRLKGVQSSSMLHPH